MWNIQTKRLLIYFTCESFCNSRLWCKSTNSIMIFFWISRKTDQKSWMWFQCQRHRIHFGLPPTKIFRRNCRISIEHCRIFSQPSPVFTDNRRLLLERFTEKFDRIWENKKCVCNHWEQCQRRILVRTQLVKTSFKIALNIFYKCCPLKWGDIFATTFSIQFQSIYLVSNYLAH